VSADQDGRQPNFLAKQTGWPQLEPFSSSCLRIRVSGAGGVIGSSSSSSIEITSSKV